MKPRRTESLRLSCNPSKCVLVCAHAQGHIYKVFFNRIYFILIEGFYPKQSLIMAADCSDSSELLLLTTYIEESDNWLHATLERLGWTTDVLENRKVCAASAFYFHFFYREHVHHHTQESPHLVQCTQNSRHFVSSFSAASHALRCQYASKGIHLDSDNEVRPYIN